jgi:hypothetical protein
LHDLTRLAKDKKVFWTWRMQANVRKGDKVIKEEVEETDDEEEEGRR